MLSDALHYCVELDDRNEALERAKEAEQDVRQALQGVVLAGFSRSWVANAAITNDIEAFRRICLEHADWWNNVAWPALAAASVTEADLPIRSV
jgi:hypothetical protein